MPKSFVYLMRCGDYIKVGHAVNPTRRLHEIRCANPARVSLEHVIECDLAAVPIMEGLVQGLLINYHHRGEWFAMSPKTAMGIIDKAVDLHKEAVGLWGNPDLTAAQVAKKTGIDLRTLYNQLGARSVLNPKIRTGGNKAGPKQCLVPEDDAERMWKDRKAYPSPKNVAEFCGVSPRTLYNRFGSRMPTPALKRKKQ